MPYTNPSPRRRASLSRHSHGSGYAEARCRSPEHAKIVRACARAREPAARRTPCRARLCTRRTSSEECVAAVCLNQHIILALADSSNIRITLLICSARALAKPTCQIWGCPPHGGPRELLAKTPLSCVHNQECGMICFGLRATLFSSTAHRNVEPGANVQFCDPVAARGTSGREVDWGGRAAAANVGRELPDARARERGEPLIGSPPSATWLNSESTNGGD